jgi:hypothetical protein
VRKLIAGATAFHLRRMCRIMHGHHLRGEQVLVGEVARRYSDPKGNTPLYIYADRADRTGDASAS